MRNIIRQTLIAGTAIIGLSSFAIAAPPVGVGNPTDPHTVGAAVSREMTAEQQIAGLHTKLMITAAQQTQWDQFAAVMRDNAKAMDQLFNTRAQALPTMTAAANMNSYAGIATEHAKDVEKLVPAFATLYATMSDAQKHTADLVFRDDAAQGTQAKGG